MTADQTPLSPEPGPDAGIDDIQADIEHTRKELGETIGALSAKADVTGRVQQKAADTKDRVTEKASETKGLVVEKVHAAQSAARDAVTDSTGSVKPGVPIAALVAAAAIVAISVAVWRRRR
jgi:cobalamin biosynthesis Mg chelatase CobN